MSLNNEDSKGYGDRQPYGDSNNRLSLNPAEDSNRKPYSEANRLNNDDSKGYGDRKPYSDSNRLTNEDSKGYGDRKAYSEANRLSLNTAEDGKGYGDRKPYNEASRLSLNTEDDKGYVVSGRSINRLPGYISNDHESNRLANDHNSLSGYESSRLPGYVSSDHSNGYNNMKSRMYGDDGDNEDDGVVVSVLDAREAKLRRLRMMDDRGESEESGIESEEGERESRLKELLTVRKCPKVKPDLNEKVGVTLFCLYLGFFCLLESYYSPGNLKGLAICLPKLQ